MAPLKEIKGRIASVNSTLKITSAMKMVASAKLRKAQNALGNMNAYQAGLSSILSDLLAGAEEVAGGALSREREVVKNVALVCFASNSSLCGGFNNAAIKEALRAAQEWEAAGASVTVFSIGRKMAEAMRKAGRPSPEDFSRMSASPSYEAASALAENLAKAFLGGTYDRIELIYNHFKSTASQPTVRETFLPLAPVAAEDGKALPPDYIIEPDRQTQIELLIPKVVRLKIYSVLLDSAAAEHAARTVAMQTATDNGEDLLSDLTLEYNKGRQQKITSEILDLEGGQME